jgi:hypothetical protein
MAGFGHEVQHKSLILLVLDAALQKRRARAAFDTSCGRIQPEQRWKTSG